MKPTFLQVRIDPKLKARFKKLSRTRGHDMSRVVVALIQSWCDEIKWPKMKMRGRK